MNSIDKNLISTSVYNLLVKLYLLFSYVAK